MKKLISCLLVCTLLLPLIFIPASAASASISLTASAATVYMGNRVSVYIKIQGSEKIGSWNFSLSYDPAYLEYVSGADAGGGGSLLFVDSADGVSSISKTVVFKTKRLGSTKVTVNPSQIIGFDSMKPMSASAASRNITVAAAPTLSGENNLSALSVSPGTLEPAFDPATVNYTLSVPFDVTELTVGGTPSHQAASVAVSGTSLAVGENKVEVVCTAQNGSTKVYTITVTRQESELAGAVATVGDKTYTVSHDPTLLTVPEGFTSSTLLLGEKKILGFLSPKGSIAIVHLTREEESGWFVFDREKEAFSPMAEISSAAQNFILLTPPADVSVPLGFIPAEITVGEKVYSVYRNENLDSENLFLVYSMARDGSVGFYYYDAATASFLTYFTSSVSAGADGGADAPSELVEKMEQENKKLEIMFLSAALVAALLAIGLVLTFILLPKKGKKEKSAKEERKESKGEEKDEYSTLLMGEEEEKN